MGSNGDYKKFLADKTQAFGPRKKGSVRFAPYFRVQVYRAHVGAWSDVKGTFATKLEAEQHIATLKLEARVREISMSGIRIL